VLKKVQTMMPDGTIPVGIGLGLLGFCIYVFQSLATHTFGQTRYAPFGAMWLLTFVVVPGLFLPIEQELARALSSRRARGEGSGPLVKKAAFLAFGLFLASAVITLIFSSVIVRVLFKGNWSLLFGFLFALFGYVFAYIIRGTLAGKARFAPYGTLLGLEGVVRVSFATVLLITHYSNYLVWGLLVGGAPLVAAIIVLTRQRNLTEDGPDAKYSELSASLGWLLLGSLVAQLLLNIAPLVVQATAHTHVEHNKSSTFTSSVFISRIPLFMFQAVQAALLPKLAHLATTNETEAFKNALKRLMMLVVAIGAAATLFNLAIGPWFVQKMFGAEFVISRGDLALLALGNAIFMIALALAQALIALSELPKAAQSWTLGVVVFAIVAATTTGFYLRAELALVAGAAASMLAMFYFVRRALRSAGKKADVGALIDAAAPYHELVEP
jgi:O-antigen/teichoic acid export membrane protein